MGWLNLIFEKSISMVTKKDDIGQELRFILNEVPFAVLLEDNQGGLQFVNTNFCKLFNIPLEPAEIIGLDCKKAAASAAPIFKEPLRFLDRLTEILAKKEPIRQEMLELADGRVYLRDYLPIMNNSFFEGQVWIYYDYTDARKLEAKKRNLKKFYERILLNIPADIAVFDKDHKYLFVNKRAIKNDEIREWIIGKDDFDYVAFRGRDISIAEKRRALFQQVVIQKEFNEFLEENITPEGNVMYNLRRMHPFYAENNELEFVVGYGIDVTSIKNAEENVIRREKNLAQITEILSIAVIVIDQSFQVIYTNSSFESTFGYDSSDVIGKSIHEIAIENIASLLKEIEKTKETGVFEGTTKEYIFHDKYGSKRCLSISFVPYNNAENNEVFYAIFFSDVTDQHLAVSELQKIIEKEKRLNELKSGFVNIVSHEMRTPLSVIQSSAQIMQMLNQANKLNNTEIDFHTNRIVNEVSDMENLMEELLLISKIESGKVDFRPYPQDLVNFVKVLLHEKFAQLTDGRQMKVLVKGVNHEVEFDRMMMNHILNNIIGNAFKYSEGKKEPILRLYFRQQTVTVMVVDFGIGIPAKDLQNLFKTFSRASNVDGINGTGLGLHVVKYFTDFHKAKIYCKSKINKGTCIMIEFNYKSYSNAKNSTN